MYTARLFFNFEISYKHYTFFQPLWLRSKGVFYWLILFCFLFFILMKGGAKMKSVLFKIYVALIVAYPREDAINIFEELLSYL